MAAIPDNIHCAQDYEDLAREVLDPAIFVHLMGGAGRESAARINRDALDAVRIVPRVLRDLTGGSAVCRMREMERPHPIFLAPVAFQRLFHSGAELETARGAAAVGAPLILSTLSSTTLEDVARNPAGERWFQLYVQPSREVTLDLVRRAEAAGYTALMLTVDASVKAVAPSALRAGFQGQETSANLAGYEQPPLVVEPGASRVFQGFAAIAPTWADIEWLRDATTLPLWLKGVLHPDDARKARDLGVAGVVVSNHGGRVLDAAPASLTMLRAVRAAVGDSFPIMADGGIRSGEDVFRVLALGADAVMVGRLQASALAVAGGLGVAHMVRLLREELEICMAQAGCATLTDVRAAELLMAGGTGT